MSNWIDTGHFAARGFLGGGQVGINNFLSSQSGASRIDGLVTFAGRAGLAADRWFVFAKGGLAYVNENHSAAGIVSSVVPPAVIQTAAASGNEYRVAPMVGLGAEYALGGNWSVKGEYNFIHLGSRTVRLPGSSQTSGPITFNEQIDQAIHVAKVGVNYRFGEIQTGPTLAPVPAAPGYNWSGAYIGAQGAYGFGRAEWPDFVDPTIPGSGKYNVDGWLAGGTGGVNAQAGAFVFGVEGEWMWTNIKGSRSITESIGGIGSQTTSLDTKIDWLAIAAARAGFVVADRLLIYGKAGIAIAQEKHAFSVNQSAPGLGTATQILKAEAIHTGVVGGVGAEYALGGNWSVKVEYDYIKMLGQNYLGTGFLDINTPGVVGVTLDTQRFGKQSQDLHLIKFGVNYHFSPTPVVVSARY
jgi:outer membrane immunogenic protein